MAWTAVLVSATKEAGLVVASVRFTESATGETFVETYRSDTITDASLAKRVAEKLASIATRDAVTLTLGPITPASLAPTQAEIYAKAFFADQRTLMAYRSANAAGVLSPAEQTTATNLATSLKSRFRPEYAADSRWMR